MSVVVRTEDPRAIMRKVREARGLPGPGGILARPAGRRIPGRWSAQR